MFIEIKKQSCGTYSIGKCTAPNKKRRTTQYDSRKTKKNEKSKDKADAIFVKTNKRVKAKGKGKGHVTALDFLNGDLRPLHVAPTLTNLTKEKTPLSLHSKPSSRMDMHSNMRYQSTSRTVRSSSKLWGSMKWHKKCDDRAQGGP